MAVISQTGPEEKLEGLREGPILLKRDTQEHSLLCQRMQPHVQVDPQNEAAILEP